MNADFPRLADVPHICNQQIVDARKFSVDTKTGVRIPLHLNGARNESVPFGLEVEVGDQINASITNRFGDFDTRLEKLTYYKVRSGESYPLSIDLHLDNII